MLTRRRLLGLLAVAPLAGPALVKAAPAAPPKAQQAAPRVHQLAVELKFDDRAFRASIEQVSRSLDKLNTVYATAGNKLAYGGILDDAEHALVQAAERALRLAP